MSEKPILFSGPMVRAILAGQKTQTRRCAWKPGLAFDSLDVPVWPMTQGDCHGMQRAACPYDADRLWVRETWRTVERDGIDGVEYAADGAFVPIANTREAADAWVDDHQNGKHGQKWRPSIFLRRWACRLALAVESIRVERLQDISEEDARAEGVSLDVGCPCKGEREEPGPHLPLCAYSIGEWPGETPFDLPDPHRMAFAALWQSINGKRPGCSWDANPWAWVVTFSRVTP